jgi:hypothetical protein
MYNPEGSDNNNEYIEIYSEEQLNTSHITIRDLVSEDNVELLQFSTSSYYLIVEEGFNYSEINATILSVGTTIGNGLNNDGDLIILLNNSNILDAIHYYPEWGAENNGKSLCKINNIWSECIQTPGYDNTEYQIEYTIRINEFLPDPEGNDSAPMPAGEWIELYNYGMQVIDLTGLILKDDRGTELFITNTTTYSLTINPESFNIIYINGKYGFLNNDGFEKIELLSPNNQKINEVTYSDSREGNSWSYDKDTWHITKPTPNEKNLKKDEEKNSEIIIKEVYLGNDKKAKFGDNLRIRLEIHKGDETKEQIKVFIEKNGEKITKITTFNIEEKYSENTLTVPVQIFPNCNSKYKEGTYQLIATGLDVSANKDIRIEGITDNLCETITETHIKSSQTASASNINPSERQSSIKVYESESEKSRRAALFFFCLILILVIFQLNLEKWKK